MRTENDKASAPALKYNFVFFFAIYDYIAAMLGKELYRHPCVRIYKYAFRGNGPEEFLFHLHTAYSINKKCALPFKSVWFKRMYQQNFNNDLPDCFVYLGGNMARYDGGFIDYVHRQDPRNRVVMIHWDLISKKVKYDYSLIKNKVDLAVTYDKAEAEKYGIHYFQDTIYSKMIEAPIGVRPKWDVYYLGDAKDRLDRLHEIYGYLSRRGVKCRFMIAGVPKEKRLSGEGLVYIDHISYKENLKYVIESKCILEVTQLQASDFTLRTKEAIAYEKRLITDCTGGLDSFFHEGQLIRFTEVPQIDTDAVKAELPAGGYPPLLDMDPMKRLYDIQDQLERMNG